MHDYKGFFPDEIHGFVGDKTVKLAKVLGGDGFTYMTTTNVNNLIEAHSDPLMDEDLTEMRKLVSEDEQDEQDEQKDEGRSYLSIYFL